MRSWFKKIYRLICDKGKILFWSCLIGVIVLRILLITGIPKMLIYGPHDDLFFAKAADFMMQGQWMGPYNDLTLIKSPFYSFFLIGSFFSGLPLYLYETLFYISSTLVLFFAIEPLVKNPWWRMVCFLLVLFLPQSLAFRMHLRVYREFVYFSLTLFVTACAIGLLLRVNQKPANLVPWSIGLGLSMGAFLLTREEGIWIYPMIFFLLLCALIFVWKKKEVQKIKKSIYILLPVLIWFIPILIVSHVNYVYYGYWGVSEQLDGDLNRVLNTLARIETDEDWHPAIQISKQARLKAYEASSSLRDFQGMLEYNVDVWNERDDGTMALKPEWYLQEYGVGGDEIGNGHFLWLFRDVLSKDGYYSEGRYPSTIYRQIADELESACEEHRLDCQEEKLLPAMVGTIEMQHLPIIQRMLSENLTNILKQEYIGITSLDIPHTWPVWPSGNEEYLILEKFAKNPIKITKNFSDVHSSPMMFIDDEFVFSRILYKEEIMRKISAFYQIISLPTFIFTFLNQIILILLIIYKYGNENWSKFLIVSVFLEGLFITRLLTLTIVDATTSIRGINYSASTYIFVPIFSIIMIYWGCSTIEDSLFLKFRKEFINPILKQ
jgi:hypothetical protein